MGITRGLETMGNTRFMTAYRCLRSVQRSLPALRHCVRKGVVDLKKAKVQQAEASGAAAVSTGNQRTVNLSAYLDGSTKDAQFTAHLNFAVHALQPLAWALKLIEALATTTADIFLHWLAIANQYLERFQDPDSPWVAQYPAECREIITRFNIQFKKGILNQDNCLYAAAFFLHPQFHSNSVLRDNDDVLQPIGRRLFKIFTAMSQKRDDVDCGTHPVSVAACKNFYRQLSQYKHQEPPFDVAYHPSIQETPQRWWQRLLHVKGDAVKELASVAIMLFSVKPSSLPEERCGSIMDWLMPGRRNRLKPSTLVQLIKLRNFYLYTHHGRQQLKVYTISHVDVPREVLPNTLQFDDATMANVSQEPGPSGSQAASHSVSESHAGPLARRDPVERMLPPARKRATDDIPCVIAEAADCAELRHPLIAAFAAQMTRNTDPAPTVDDGTPGLSHLADAEMVDVGKLDFSQFGMPP
jgi:hypothetical protein